jgi:hypothetical protein
VTRHSGLDKSFEESKIKIKEHEIVLDNLLYRFR